MVDISIELDDFTLKVEWIDKNTNTRRKIIETLPLEGETRKWGDELYFEVPVNVTEENPQTEVPIGAIAYWPSGNCLCIFWGPTPKSTDDKPISSDPVNVVAKITDVSPLDSLLENNYICIEEI